MARAARFHFVRDRRRFIVGRGLLRTLLGRYLRLAPAALRFAYTPLGKPFLIADDAPEPLCFNLSHSNELALFAFSRNRAVGVDIEHVRPVDDYEQIAARFFAPAECAQLRTLPDGQRARAFFSCWTRKEAYIKAHGVGLSLPLERFTVSIAPDEPAGLLATLDDPAEAARWSLLALPAGPDYEAALAVAGDGWQLSCWQWHASAWGRL
jgi:4'-phosphopantetheinyl transferase